MTRATWLGAGGAWDWRGDVLEGVVDFCADEEDEVGHVNPEHEDDEGGEGSVQARVVAEVSDVEIESGVGADESDRDEEGAGTQPGPGAARVGKKIIHQIQAEAHKDESGGPTQDF